MSPEIRELTLSKGKFEECVLYKLKKRWVLRFKLGPDCLAEDVTLYTNYPLDGDEYDRSTYHPLAWHCPTQQDRTSRYAELSVHLPGSFHFYFTISNTQAGAGYFLVDPELLFPLDSIVCQTVLSKLLGPLNTWKDKLEVAYRSGYNMVHFTPIQVPPPPPHQYSHLIFIFLRPWELPTLPTPWLTSMGSMLLSPVMAVRLHLARWRRWWTP